MESDVSDSRPHFYSLLHIRLTTHALIYPPHCIHILMLMLIHNFILVQSLILILKHTRASHFFHSFRHSPSYHFIYKLFFVITFSSQCDLQSSFSSLIPYLYTSTSNISVYPKELHHSNWIQYTYNMLHSLSRLYHMHTMYIHLASTSIVCQENHICSKLFKMFGIFRSQY